MPDEAIINLRLLSFFDNAHGRHLHFGLLSVLQNARLKPFCIFPFVEFCRMPAEAITHFGTGAILCNGFKPLLYDELIGQGLDSKMARMPKMNMASNRSFTVNSGYTFYKT